MWFLSHLLFTSQFNIWTNWILNPSRPRCKWALHENKDCYPKLPPEHILGRGSKTCVDVMGIGASVCHVGGGYQLMLVNTHMSGSTRSLRDQWAAGPAAASWSCSTKSRPWMRSPSSPLTTWGAWSTGAKLPPPSEADSYNSSSIKVIFVTPTFLPQFIFISFLFLYNDNIQTPEVSGPSCQWPWDRWIWMQSETVGFYFLETHLSPGSECLSPSLQ